MSGRLAIRVNREAERLQFIRRWHTKTYADQNRCPRIYAAVDAYTPDTWAACVLEPNHLGRCRYITDAGDIIPIPATMLEVP